MLGMLLLTALALGLRTIGLNSQLWYDEIASVLNCFRPPLGHIVTHFESGNNHPFYSVLAHGAIWLFGEHPWSVRLPAVLFGAAGIPATYLLGRQVTGGREAAFASALLALSYHHVWFSQNARGYTALAFFAALCTWLLLRGLRQDLPRWWVGYALAAALGAYTHATMAFVAAAHALALLGWLAQGWAARRALLAPILAAVGGGGLLTVLLYAPLLGHMEAEVAHASRPSHAAFAHPTRAVHEVLLEIADALGTSAALAVPAVMLACVGLASYWKQNRTIAVILLLPAIVTAAGVMAMHRPMHPRFLFFMASTAALLFMRGLFVTTGWVRGHWRHSTWRGRKRIDLEAVAALVALAVMLPALVGGYLRPKQDYQGALAYLDRHAAPGEEVVVVGITAALPLQRYYGRAWRRVSDEEELRRLTDTGKKTWLVYTIPRYLERGAPELMRGIRRNFEIRAVFPGTLAGGEIVVCASRERAAAWPASGRPPADKPASRRPASTRATSARPASTMTAWAGTGSWPRHRAARLRLPGKEGAVPRGAAALRLPACGTMTGCQGSK